MVSGGALPLPLPMLTSDSARHVVFAGLLPVHAPMAVIVMGDHLPVFLPYLRSAGLQSGLVLVTHALPKEHPLPATFTVSVTAPISWARTLANWSGSAPLALLEGRLTPAIADALEARSVSVCVSTHGSRHSIPNWGRRLLRLSHHDCGGSTITATTLVLFSRALDLAQFPVPPPKPALMSQACLSDTVSGKTTRPRPSPLATPEVQDLAVAGKPLYHSEGLLPAFPGRDVRVLAPSAFHPASTWVARYLTPEERTNVYDLPLSPPWAGLYRARVRSRLLPGKLVLTVLHSVREFLHGGGFLFPRCPLVLFFAHHAMGPRLPRSSYPGPRLPKSLLRPHMIPLGIGINWKT